MKIIVYRQKAEISVRVMKYIHDKLNAIHHKFPFGGEIQFIYAKRLIRLSGYPGHEDILIDFRSGPVERLAGLRPVYYNADCLYASRCLEQMAYKCGGIEIANLDHLIQAILVELIHKKGGKEQ